MPRVTCLLSGKSIKVCGFCVHCRLTLGSRQHIPPSAGARHKSASWGLSLSEGLEK